VRALPIIGLCSLVVLVPVAAGGCKKSPDADALPPPVQARGKVVYNGKPVANASVVFYRDAGSETAKGKTNANGEFALTTLAENDGVPPGEYKVTVAIDAGDGEGGLGDEEHPPSHPTIPLKYANPETTTLQATVKETGQTDIVLELK
jgi:hypothetical protein